ncbi:MAG TPA: hypothetical protein PKD09_24185 [Aggregatilinea sp.]|uniref:hypothetical protein n=1 Tax=Aggregatilinea sp. TaxID=2806333 RepID=UPI002CC504EC|nr:hypothetical protein [Aggregatilinea sp.]HML24775.1 hypothetical protein [Aggregatilinea sp.]
MKRSIYFNDWQACLRAHYVHVIRTNDTVTEPTLRHVLLQTGLTDAELDAIAAEARGLTALPADTPFDAGAIDPETAAAAEVPADPPADVAPADVVEQEAEAIQEEETVAEAVEVAEAAEIAPPEPDEAEIDETEPDLPGDDAIVLDDNGEIVGYDESEPDDGDLSDDPGAADDEIDENDTLDDTDTDEPPPYEPPSQQLSLF